MSPAAPRERHASKGEIQGAAPKAQIFFQSILDAKGMLGGLPPDLGSLFEEAYKKGVRIHNNSWGATPSLNIRWRRARSIASCWIIRTC